MLTPTVDIDLFKGLIDGFFFDNSFSLFYFYLLSFFYLSTKLAFYSTEGVGYEEVLVSANFTFNDSVCFGGGGEWTATEYCIYCLI